MCICCLLEREGRANHDAQIGRFEESLSPVREMLSVAPAVRAIRTLTEPAST